MNHYKRTFIRKTGYSIGLVLMLLLISLFGGACSSDSGSGYKPAPGLSNPGDSNLIMSNTVEETDDVVKIEYTIPEPTFETTEDQTYNGEKTETCKLGNAWIDAEAGKPLMPFITSRVILPYGKSIKAIRVTPGESATLPEKHLLSFSEQPHPLSATEVVRTEADESIYQSDETYPEIDNTLVDVQNRCGVDIAIINIYPLTFVPSDRRVSYMKSLTLEVTMTTATRNTDMDGIRIRPDRISNGLQTEENPGTLKSYSDRITDAAKTLDSSAAENTYEATEEYSYLIVTSREIIEATTTPNLNDFVRHKQRLGFGCKVESIENILNSYPGSQDYDKLRNFLREAYNKWNTQYVLLGGDTNIIPLRTVYATNGNYKDYLPSDLPYQCLSQSTWNNDYEAEVYIGRVSAENATEFSNFVYKTIAYETTDPSDPYLKTALSAGEKLDSYTYGKNSLTSIERIFSSDFSFDSLFDQDGTWNNKTEIVNKVNQNKYSIINHLGHSNTNHVMKLTSGYNWNPSSFNNTKYIFAKSQGCIPGAFDRNCIAEHMTTSNRAGMWGVVFNSRYGWYLPGNVTNGSSHKLHTTFWNAYFNQGLKQAGQCNEYSHRLNSRYRWDILESNLFGDPSVIIGETNPAYNSPVADFSFQFDPEDGYVVNFTDASSCDSCTNTDYYWEFGNGTTSREQNPEHTYTAEGTYTVRLTVTNNHSQTDSITKEVRVPFTPEYCESKSKNTYYFWIDDVTIGDFSRASGAEYYSDFTSEEIPVAIGETYPISIGCGGQTIYSNYYTIWVDLNSDGDFNDQGELLYHSGRINEAPQGSLTIPASAQPGKTRMRIAQKNGSAASPCETFTFGEVEDYTISISDAQAEYCESKSLNTNYFYIDEVSIGNFSKQSGADFHSDFTSDVISLGAGSTYHLEIGCGGQTIYHNWYMIWADLNQDGDFDDQNELLYESGAAITGGGQGTITIPSSAQTGRTGLRVVQKNGSAAGTCETFTFGEVEDYTLQIN